MKIGIVGRGVVGSAMERLFRRVPDHTLAICDKYLTAYDSAAHRTAINSCDLVLLSVPTLMSADGQGCDLSAVEECVCWIEEPICIRSTVSVGTCDRLSAESGNDLAFSPEYLGESSSHPWPEDAACGFLIVGDPDYLIDLVIEAYRPAVSSSMQFYRSTAIAAEIAKYMENCFLATKVAFVNQFYDIASAFDVDYNEVRRLWLADPRIGASHTTVTEEREFRGRCLPKDLVAMIAAMQPHGGAPPLTLSARTTKPCAQRADARSLLATE